MHEREQKKSNQVGKKNIFLQHKNCYKILEFSACFQSSIVLILLTVWMLIDVMLTES
jgi:hypothetical protein